MSVYTYSSVHMSLDLETVANLAGKHEVRQNYKTSEAAAAAADSAAETG